MAASSLWPTLSNVGRFVLTAGPIELDEASAFRDLSGVRLPSGYPIQLKHIDQDQEMAYVWDIKFGVLCLPVQLFLPWK